MLEFVLCLPILGFILVLTFFFGWAMMNQQHVKTSGRYAVWRQVRGKGRAAPEQLNRDFFRSKAGNVSVGAMAGPEETLRDMIESAGSAGAEAQMFADHLIREKLPGSAGAGVAVQFPTTVGLWQRFNDPIKHTHTREGVEWRRTEAACEEVIRDDFLAELDVTVQGLSGTPARKFGEVLRRLYNQQW